MQKIDANPLQSGGKIDPTNPTSALKKVLLMVAGFAVFFTALAFGQDAGNYLTAQVRSLLGLSAEDGNGSGVLGEI